MNELCKALLKMNNVPELDDGKIRMMNPLALAYVGDGVHEIMVRTYVISKYNGTVNHLNQRVVKMIKATAQAQVVREIQDRLTEEEIAIVKRGRNQKSATVPKNTSVGEYRQATGFEALLGWLFLTGKEERLVEIVTKAIEIGEMTLKDEKKHQEQPYE